MAITRLPLGTAVSGNLDLASNVTGTLPRANATSGSVIQVARTAANVSSPITTSSSSLVGSGIQVSLTPTASGNVILVDFVSSMADHNQATNLRGKFYRKIGTGSFNDAGGEQYEIGYNTTTNTYAPLSASVSFTTTSTDTVTYEVYFRSNTTSESRLVHGGASYALTMMEIAP